ncbi:hypothetical protein RB195_018447 [Necator americanus]|uniref:Reverse transcriptase RNase H-like domain-containing protein n=1 Tax=Necator americanus TaxID=51031 RepID=A0ABR1C9V9_NECAM
MVPVYTANRLQRWKLILLGYDFEIEYQKTTEFGQADVLSRLIPPRPAQTEDIPHTNEAEINSAPAVGPSTLFSTKLDISVLPLFAVSLQVHKKGPLYHFILRHQQISFSLFYYRAMYKFLNI